MILGGDLHPAGLQVFYRLVGPPMAEFQLEGGPPQGQAQDLMAQTDAENRQEADQVRGQCHDPGVGRRVSRSVGKQNAVRLQGQDFPAGVKAGTTSTWQPRCSRLRRILYLTP